MGNHDIYTCIACGLKRDDVECAGIYYCPNKLCTVCGALYHKTILKSFKETEKGATVDAEEVLKWGEGLMKEETDENMKKAMGKMMIEWTEKYIYYNVLYS